MRQLLYYCIEKGTFLTKRLTFYKNDADFSKIKGFLALNATFYETMKLHCLYVQTEFQVPRDFKAGGVKLDPLPTVP